MICGAMGAFYYPPPRTGRGGVSYTTGTQADLIQVSQRLAGSNLVDFLNSPTAKSNWIGGVFMFGEKFIIIYVDVFSGHDTLGYTKGTFIHNTPKKKGEVYGDMQTFIRFVKNLFRAARVGNHARNGDNGRH